jgi:hypothetical protein
MIVFKQKKIDVSFLEFDDFLKILDIVDMLFFTSSFFSSITAIHQTKEADEII